MPALSVTKIDAARSQLETAVRLFFEERDPVSIHTLTCAAYDVLHDMGRPQGLEPIFKGALFIRESQREKYRDKLNRPRNFFKHADRDPQERLKFDPEVTAFFLFDACEFYERFTRTVPLLLDLYRAYFYVRYPEFIQDPDIETRVRTLRADPRALERPFWRDQVRELLRSPEQPSAAGVFHD